LKAASTATVAAIAHQGDEIDLTSAAKLPQ
jgi:hypothetical protein